MSHPDDRSGNMPTMDEIVSVTARHKSAQVAANILANNRLQAMLDGYKPAPLTRWQRIKRKFGNGYCRVRDAWWVLTGKAEISYAEDE